jgi:RNA polymerase sigma-70 factor (ECF subfamily)
MVRKNVERGVRLRVVPTQEGTAPRPPVSAPSLSLDDSELIAAVRRGDRSAATAFHDRLRPRVDGTIRRLLGGRDSEHEDLAQQTMIAIVGAIDRYRGDCSLESWASSIAANVVYNHLRRRSTERGIFQRESDGDQASPVSSTMGRGIVVRDLLERVRAHLETLSLEKAWTFLLHDVHGYDVQEIAEITSTSVAAAQSRLVRARREIHERIAADPELAGYFDETEAES